VLREFFFVIFVVKKTGLRGQGQKNICRLSSFVVGHRLLLSSCPSQKAGSGINIAGLHVETSLFESIA